MIITHIFINDVVVTVATFDIVGIIAIVIITTSITVTIVYVVAMTTTCHQSPRRVGK